MENNNVETLFLHDGGRWKVTTESSRYIIDLDALTLTREPGSDPEHHRPDRNPSRTGGRHKASKLRKDEQTISLLDMAPVIVGYPLSVLIDIVGNGVITARRSTRVVSIAQL